MRLQVDQAMPYRASKKRNLPSGLDVKTWARQLLTTVTDLVARRKIQLTKLDLPTANEVQRAVLVSLVVGLDFPPLPLVVLKTMMHPVKNGTCHDPKCVVRECAGNRIEKELDGEHALTVNVSHGKTEQSPRIDVKYSVPVPTGDLANLLALHIEEGNAVLTKNVPEGTSADRLFVNKKGLPFAHYVDAGGGRRAVALKHARFTQYWTWALKGAPSYFCPNEAMGMYIEDAADTAPQEHGVLLKYKKE
eukprot:gene29255-12498_t